MNEGIPQAYRTVPTWDVPEANQNKKIDDCFQPATKPSVSPQHPMMNQQPYQGQIPFHPQQGQMQHGHTPHHTPRHHPVQPHHAGPGTPHHYEDQHRMQFSQSTSSVHPSPRVVPQYLAFNGQTPQPGAFYQQPGQAYGGQPMFARQASSGGPPQFIPQGPMAGHMMTGQPPTGPYMNMQMNHQMAYAVMPGQMYAQHGSPMPQQAGPNGYPSPRPPAPMMSHQGSQQGHPVQPMVYMQQQPAHGPPMYAQAPGVPITPMRQHYAQPHQQQYGSGPPHFPQQQQHRGTPSASYSQPTMMGGPPQGMPPSGVPMGPDGAEDGK